MSSGQAALKTLRFVAGLLCISGIGQTIASLVTLGNTSGIFNGGIWTGIICLILCSSILNNKRSVRAFQCLTFSCMIAFISACISTAILSNEESLLKNTETCASDCSSSSQSCVDFTGSKSQFNELQSVYCFSQADFSVNCNCYVNPAYLDQDDDGLNKANCLYLDLANCDILFTKLPSMIKWSYGFSLACLILSFMLMIASCSIVYVPQYREEIIIVESSPQLQQPIYIVNAGQAQYSNQPTPVYVTATTSNPAYYSAQGQPTVVVVEPYVQNSQQQNKTYGV